IRYRLAAGIRSVRLNVLEDSNEPFSTRHNQFDHSINAAFWNCRCTRVCPCLNYLGKWQDSVGRRRQSSPGVWHRGTLLHPGSQLSHTSWRRFSRTPNHDLVSCDNSRNSSDEWEGASLAALRSVCRSCSYHLYWMA